jgi:Na+/proline symporter
VSRDLPAALGVRVAPGREVTIARVTMAILGVGAIGFAMSSGEMVAALGALGYGTLMSATMPVFLFGLLWKRASTEGVLAGLLVSAAGNVIAPIATRAGFNWPGGLPWYVGVVAITAAVTVAVSLVTTGATGDELDERVKLAIEL